jgi:STIP1 homology and U-box containing protein 1
MFHYHLGKDKDYSINKPNYSINIENYGEKNNRILIDKKVSKIARSILQGTKDPSTPNPTTVSNFGFPKAPRRQSVIEVEETREKEEFLAEIERLNHSIKHLSHEKRKLLRNSDLEISALQRRIEELESSKKHTEKHLSETERFLAELLKEIQDLEEAIICPITLEVMNDPVISTMSGQTFERSAILEALAIHAECPKTKLAMTETDLKPNFALKSVIEVYQRKLAQFQSQVRK